MPRVDTAVPDVKTGAPDRGTFSARDPRQAHDVERRLLLCLSVVDHGVNSRDRYQGTDRETFLAQVLTEARAALDGATIDQLLEARGA